MRKSMKVALVGTALALSASSAQAAIVMGEVTGGSSGGNFVELDPAPGTTVGQDSFNSPDLIAFNEVQDVVLASALAGLAAGTGVSSHFVLFDPVNSPTTRVIGNVTFDSEILAIITSSGAISATDGLFGNPNVTYLPGGAYGLESNDSASFAGNQLFVNFVATSPGDHIRVLTRSAVPEPGTWAMMILGFFALGAAMRRKPAVARHRVTYA